jgi:hypothetical protein
MAQSYPLSTHDHFYLWKKVRVLRPSNNIPNTTFRIFTYVYIQGYDDISQAYMVRLIRTAVNPRGSHSLELPAPACVGSRMIQKSKHGLNVQYFIVLSHNMFLVTIRDVAAALIRKTMSLCPVL